MANVKTAVSLERPLFDRADALARQMRIPRSRLFARALTDFLSRHEEAEIVRRLNEVYGDEPPDPAEKARLASMSRHHWRLMKDQW
jgi:hypothetical protein